MSKIFVYSPLTSNTMGVVESWAASQPTSGIVPVPFRSTNSALVNAATTVTPCHNNLNVAAITNNISTSVPSPEGISDVRLFSYPCLNYLLHCFCRIVW